MGTSRKRAGLGKRAPPTIGRVGSKPRRVETQPPLVIVEEGQKDPTKEPTDPFSAMTDTNRKTGEYPVGTDEEMDEKPQELQKFEPTALHISLMSFEEMQSRSVVDVEVTAKDNIPVPNSVNDPFLGPYDPLAVCAHCVKKDCPGHYGLITFPTEYPVPNPIFLDYISRVLSCVCNSCAKLLVSKELLESQGHLLLTGYDRFNSVTRICKNVTCPRRTKTKSKKVKGKGKGKKKIKTGVTKVCSANPKYFPGHSGTNGWIAYRISDKDKGTNIMDPRKVLDILDAISDEDARYLGFNAPESHPRDMVLQGLPVVPTSARPPYIQGATIQCDQLTEIYNKIIRAMAELTNASNVGGKCMCYKEMIAAVKELMVGNNAKKYHNRPPMPIASRLQGKNGIFRRLLMGKRTDHCARTVLGPDADIRFGQIRIPKYIADRLVARVRVFEHNKHAVEEMVRQNKVLYITNIKGDTFRYLPDSEKRKYKIEIGTTVERKLQNGDVIAFNRQPTLHKYSLMAYEIVIGKQNTIGLHLSVTTPHNADFDGDEGNLWSLLNLMSVAEGQYIMDVKKCLISSQTNKPIIGLIMNTVTGLYMLTYKNDIFSPDEFSSLLNRLTNTSDVSTLTRRAIKHGVHPYSGRALFSSLLPKDFYYKSGDVEVVEGILVHGAVTSKQLSTAHRSIIQELRKDPRYGSDRAIDLLTDAPYLATAYLDAHGFSVGITDCAPAMGKDNKRVQKAVAQARNQYEAILNEPTKSKVEEVYKEQQIVALLSELQGMELNLAKDRFSGDNAIRIMAKEIGGGAKGNKHNVTQIAALLGQQFIFGNRPENQITGKTRALCTFASGDTSMESKGCVLHSFSEGLSMSEFFFHAMSSRQGLMDTAIKTAEIGAIHHKMVKAVEGVVVAYDGSVRDHLGNIIQFSYGNDGFDASELVSIPTNGTQNLATFIDLKMTVAQLNIARGWAPRETAKRIRQQRKKLLRSLYSRE